jgi:hypothetical protein
MKKDQLFRTRPPLSVCILILKAIGLSGFKDNHYFSRADLEKNNGVEKIEVLKPILIKYYLPCKARTYLYNLNTKNIITILRQIVKLYDFKILSTEKYIKGYKFIIYQLVPINNKKYKIHFIKQEIKPIRDKTNCIVVFD